MFGIEQTFPEAFRFFFSLICAAIVIWRCGGVSALFRILLRVAGLNFKKGVLGRADDEIFYTQKFMLLNGVKVENTKDAKLLSNGLLTGEISKKNFYFTSFFGTVGKSKSSPHDTTLLVAFITIIILFSISLLSNFPKSGYTNFNYKDTSLLVSQNDVIIPAGMFEENKILNINACTRVIKTHPYDAYRAACEYIALQDEKKNQELIDAINSWDDMRKISFIIFMSILIFSACLIWGIINHKKLNEHILQCREKEYKLGINSNQEGEK
ncbi:hypothetical protein [Serratia entomophila]|uniref:hypothetical protein n=1 Tax=Serratia entomophila TaxID=42906 RepID=UPI00217BA926|nr:hypothetical protein [Serratia entomophila]CAI1628484.1 Uncharacterised protein [Serratia entomophila]